MTNRKNQNSILFLTTLGVLFFVASAFAQSLEDKTEQDKQGVFVNRRPMRDFEQMAAEQIESGRVNIEAPFRVVVSGNLASKNEGKHIVLADAKIEPVTQPEDSDPGMVKLAHDGIMALSDAGYFAYFDKLSVKTIVIAVEQTGDTFSVDIRADQPSEAKAKAVASSFDSLISVAASLAKNDEKKSDDARMMLSAMNVTSESSVFIISLKLQKAQFQELIKRKIAESKTTTRVSG